MTSALDEKWRPFKFFFSRVGLRTYQHPCSIQTCDVRERERETSSVNISFDITTPGLRTEDYVRCLSYPAVEWRRLILNCLVFKRIPAFSRRRGFFFYVFVRHSNEAFSRPSCCHQLQAAKWINSRKQPPLRFDWRNAVGVMALVPFF